MNLRIGDKVSFLNERGGGVITRFQSPMVAMVETPDGFEIPYKVAELVSENYASTTNVIVSPVVAQVKDDTPGQQAVTLAEGIYLCFLPDNLKDLSNARFTVSLYNNTTHDILFNLFSKNTNGHNILGSDRLLAGKSIKIDNLPTGYIDKYSGGVLQVLFYSATVKEVKAPQDIAFKIKTVKLLEKENFNLLAHFNSLGIATALYPKTEQKAEIEYGLDDLKNRFAKDERKPITTIPKQQIMEMEVDLHIEELIDDMRGLSNSDMLQIQLTHARKKLDEAVTLHYRKVVFIHGVGNGKLKTEVRKFLSGYKGLEFFDASYAKYGAGATEVRLGNVRLG